MTLGGRAAPFGVKGIVPVTTAGYGTGLGAPGGRHLFGWDSGGRGGRLWSLARLVLGTWLEHAGCS